MVELEFECFSFAIILYYGDDKRKCGDFNPNVFPCQYDKFGPFLVNLQSSTRGMNQI
jgi:hypothetical protein